MAYIVMARAVMAYVAMGRYSYGRFPIATQLAGDRLLELLDAIFLATFRGMPTAIASWSCWTPSCLAQFVTCVGP